MTSANALVMFSLRLQMPHLQTDCKPHSAQGALSNTCAARDLSRSSHRDSVQPNHPFERLYREWTCDWNHRKSR